MTTMKVAFILIIVSSFISCKPKITNKNVETIGETYECILGEWEPEKKILKEGVYPRIIFLGDNSLGNNYKSGIFIIQAYDSKKNKVSNKRFHGTWKINDIGKIKMKRYSMVWDIGLINCGRLVLQKGEINVKIRNYEDLLSDFEYFNILFHSNQNFQLSRVKFPLKGGLYTLDGNSKWDKGNWLFHSEVVGANPPSGYKNSVTIDKNVVHEKIWVENSGIYYDRVFEKIDNEWYLTTYEVHN
jgi:hypothetical protein